MAKQALCTARNSTVRIRILVKHHSGLGPGPRRRPTEHGGPLSTLTLTLTPYSTHRCIFGVWGGQAMTLSTLIPDRPVLRTWVSWLNPSNPPEPWSKRRFGEHAAFVATPTTARNRACWPESSARTVLLCSVTSAPTGFIVVIAPQTHHQI